MIFLKSFIARDNISFVIKIQPTTLETSILFIIIMEPTYNVNANS